MNDTNCTCENKEVCGKRIAHGLIPFCRMTAPVRVRPVNEFSNYPDAAAYARVAGGRVRRIGNLWDGGPRRLVVVP